MITKGASTKIVRFNWGTPSTWRKESQDFQEEEIRFIGPGLACLNRD